MRDAFGTTDFGLEAITFQAEVDGSEDIEGRYARFVGGSKLARPYREHSFERALAFLESFAICPGRVSADNNGEPLRFRAAQRSDVPSMVALEQSAFSVHQLGTSAFRRMIERESALVLVCERGGEFLGHAVVLFRAGTRVARIYSIAVVAQHRRLGTGRALLAELVRITREKGLRTLSLEVRSLDDVVRDFYERFGFSFKMCLPAYYDDGAEAVRLIFDLRS